uniref:F-box domain-containing protein n=1 Tax=Leersia perrieri TaxID=77586 RepID=A0A0D9VZN8_9ORYZ
MAKRKREMSKRKRGVAVVKRKRRGLQLSDLPTDILCCIISQLSIKEAARTAILSKHWKYVWHSRRNLLFSFKSMMPRSYNSRPYASRKHDQDFIDRVEAVLKQHPGAGVDKMEVCYAPLSNQNADYIDRWLCFAIATKTRHLIFDFTPFHAIYEPYRFPLEIFSATNSSYLQSMKLGAVSLKQPENFNGFLNIKKLELKDVDITDEGLQLLLTKCHALEFLGVSLCGRLTSIQTSHPSSRLKHLQVYSCPSVTEIKLNLGLKALEYQGSLIPLAPPGTLTNLCINSSDACSALVYIFSGLPSTLPCLETLTLKSEELERASLLDKPPKFIYLRNLRLELIFPCKIKADVLDFACLLEAAPFLENLEFHMWMDMNSTGLKTMRIEPKPMVAARYVGLSSRDAPSSADGYKVANKYISKEDHRGVVHITRVRRRDVVNAPTFHLIDPQRFPLLPEI